MTGPRQGWTELSPKLRAPQHSRSKFTEIAKRVARLGRANDSQALEEFRRGIAVSAEKWPPSARKALIALAHLLVDLAQQGWELRVRSGRVTVRPAVAVESSVGDEKDRIRRQELVTRDAQLRRVPVRKFVQEMECRRVFNGRFVSIFSLMRDGRELALRLREARAHASNGSAHLLDAIVDPYLQFVSEGERCEHSGLRTMDIWRYFRHTWANQYVTVPGRSMMFLVRDRAAPTHPIMGIGAISSPILQIRERDEWIGWHPEMLLEEMKTRPTARFAKWLKSIVDRGVEEVYVDDFLEDETLRTRDLSAPRPVVIARLRKLAQKQRDLHHRWVKSSDYKPFVKSTSDDYWSSRARMHLFRSKRALALADLLEIRIEMAACFGRSPTARGLSELLSVGLRVKQVRKVLRKAKADRVGILMADISVCGAVQPYNALLGGKLTAMLATSPEVVEEYKRRYGKMESEIASSMAGRPIVRPAHLAVLSTTSLYGVGASQYNRIRIPCELLAGVKGEVVEYRRLGYSEAFGTSQYSDETVKALGEFLETFGRRRVNAIFGEGSSPKMRNLRESLDRLQLPAKELLRHHRRRIVYGITLVRNTRDFLLGLDKAPDYLFEISRGPEQSARIARWWRDRWLRNRIQADDVLAAVERHTLVLPVSHGGRVTTRPALAEHEKQGEENAR